MVFPVVGGNESKGYDVENSLRFNASDSPQLSKDMSGYGNATNTKKFTTSFWLKPGNVPQTSYGGIIDVGGDHTISLFSDNTLYFFENGGSDLYWRPTRLFRDPSAWYNIIIIADSTLSTQTDRVKIYVNGVIETSFHNNSGPSQNHDFAFNTVNTRYIGRKQSTSSSLDGYLTEIHHIDGQAKAHTDFGKFDDNGVWIPIKYTGTYGDTGYYLEFKQTGTSQNSSGIGADTSGEDNHFAVSNLAATDITEDTCTNNFATLNSILADGQFNSDQLSEGNTFYNEGQGNNGAGQPTATFAFNSGKWYWEVQVPSQQNSRAIGFCRMDRVSIDQPPQLHGNGFTATNSVVGIDLTDDTIDQVDNAGSHTQHVGSLTGMSDNDIFGVAVNLDDGNFQFYRNGSTYGSSYSLSNLSEWQEHGAVPCASGKSYQAYRFNFGNPAFSISSGNSDGKYGNFEYAPPSGYYALCTKRLAEFG